MNRKIWIGAVIVALCLGCVACTGENLPQTGENPGTQATLPDISDLFSQRDYDDGFSDAVTITLSDSGISAESSSVAVEGSTVAITAAGTYRITGKLTEGQLQIRAGEQDKVHLILDGASVSCSGSAALYILSGDKVFVTLAEGTENALASAGEFTATDENAVDGAVFSKSDLTFNGTGSLAVLSETGHGIVCKDELRFTNGTYTVSAALQGITGKDCISIADGSFTVVSGTDGLHSKHDEDASRGNITILAGSFDITAGNDGMDATGNVVITGGTFRLFTGEGSDSVTHSDGDWGGMGGMGGWWGSSSDTETNTESRKGIKAGAALQISGGSLTIDAEDDALHSNDSVTVSGGSFTVASGDDAFHGDNALTISGGEIHITKSYEGLEGTYITVSGGNIRLVAFDDGMNAAGGNDGSGMAGPWGQGGFGEATDAWIVISGGELVLNAGGDGIDSNGDLTVSGGTVFLDGPENAGNGALDYAGEGKITGGVFLALGARGMDMNFGNNSTQCALLCSLNGTASAGTELTFKDASGKVLVRYTSQKTFSSILVSTPDMAQGQTYTVTVGEATGEFTLDAIINGTGSGMGGGPGGGGPGGRPGRK